MLRQGLTESPYLTISCMMFPFPLLIIPYIFWKDKKMDGTKKMYMLKYTSKYTHLFIYIKFSFLQKKVQIIIVIYIFCSYET